MKNNEPLVSVLMTAYNREKYIAQAIESVLASTYINFELIIVDDCSTDHTLEIIKLFAAKDSRIKEYVNEKNLGDYPNRNKAAIYAKGKYLKYLDADDYIYEEGLELMVKYMERFPDVGIAITRPPHKDYPYPKKLTPYEAYKKHYFEGSFLGAAPIAVIIKTNAFYQCGGFTGKRMVGDLELFLKIAAVYNTLLLPGVYFWYRLHDSQEINTYDWFRGEYCKVDLNALENNSLLNPSEIKYLQKKIKRNYARVILFSFLIKRKNFTVVSKNLKSMNWTLPQLFKEALL